MNYLGYFFKYLDDNYDFFLLRQVQYLVTALHSIAMWSALPMALTLCEASLIQVNRPKVHWRYSLEMGW